MQHINALPKDSKKGSEEGWDQQDGNSENDDLL
jgi:hypothetical protein